MRIPRLFPFWVLLAIVLGSKALGQTDRVIQTIQPDDATGMSLAVVVGNTALAHTTQLLPVDQEGRIVGGSDAGRQIDRVLGNLGTALAEVGSTLEQLVKINVYVARNEIVPKVKRRFSQAFPQSVRPAVAFVVTPLPHPDALVAMDAVAAVPNGQNLQAVSRRRSLRLFSKSGMAHVSVLPRGGVVYVAGQSARGPLAQATRQTMQSLLATLEHLGLNRDHVVELKAFMRPMTDTAVVAKEIARDYESQDKLVPPISYVEWISGNSIEIELVAYAPPRRSSSQADELVSYITPPGMTASPVFSRVAQVHSSRTIYFSGLVAANQTDAEGQIRDIFGSLRRLLKKTGSDFRHLAKATYYVSDADASRKLNEIRPEFYDPKRPPAASKAMVKGVGMIGRTVTIDMIAAGSN